MKWGRAGYSCSFCGKGQDQVRRLIAGPAPVFICDECVALCNDIIAADTPPGPAGYQASSGQRRGRFGWWRKFLGHYRTAGATP